MRCRACNRVFKPTKTRDDDNNVSFSYLCGECVSSYYTSSSYGHERVLGYHVALRVTLRREGLLKAEDLY